MESFLEVIRTRNEWRKEKEQRKKMRKDIKNGLTWLENINQNQVKPKRDSLKELLKRNRKIKNN